MKWFVIAAITAVALFAWSLSRLSPETVGMAIGMLLGILAGVPSAALVIVALRSTPAPTQQEEWDIEYPARPTYADEVTPYTHAFRRVAGMPALPDRQAEIDQLRQYLDYLESEKVNR